MRATTERAFAVFSVFDRLWQNSIDTGGATMGDVSKATNRCSVCAQPSRLNCAKCKSPYCSVACQTDDWKDRGHKKACKRLVEAAAAKGGGAARDEAPTPPPLPLEEARQEAEGELGRSPSCSLVDICRQHWQSEAATRRSSSRQPDGAPGRLAASRPWHGAPCY